MRFMLIIFSLHFSLLCRAGDVERLLPIDRTVYSEKGKGQVLEVDTSPVSSQDTLNICFAHVAATMMQTEKCRFEGKVPCSGLTEREMFSPLDLARMQFKGNEAASPVRSSYTSLNTEGGRLIDAVRIGGLVVKQAANQACISLDRILSKINSRGNAEEGQRALWQSLEMSFKKAKAEIAEKANCEDCITNIYTTAAEKISPLIEKDLNLKVDPVQLGKAFAADTYNEFLNDFLGAKKCIRPTEMATFPNAENLRYVSFPENGEPDTSPKEIIDKVKHVLKNGRPLALNGICYANVAASSCPIEKYHAVVIAGYREVCKANGECRKSFKVINSWGQSWQDRNDGGWVDAETVLAATNMRTGALSWFEDKK